MRNIFCLHEKTSLCLAICGIVIAYLAVRATAWDIHPIWDAAIYATGIKHAVFSPFDPKNFAIADHVTHAFAAVHSIPLLFFRDSIIALNAYHSLFAATSIVAFAAIVRKLAVSDTLGTVIAAALYAFNPAIMASAAHVNADTGVLVFFLLTWACVLYDRPFAATACALCLAFSKEPAVILIPIPLISKIMTSDAPQRIRSIARHWTSIAVPYAALLAYAIIKKITSAHGTLYAMPSTHISLEPDTGWTTMAFDVFFLQFMWIMTAAMIFLVTKNLPRLKNAYAFRSPLLMTVMTFAVFLVFSVIRTWSNPRYLLVPITLMTLTGALWLLTIQRIGKVIAAVTATLMALSCMRTVDPVSKAYFGTFNIGKHILLDRTRPTKEGHGHGRDQLVYNLEYMNIPRLYVAALAGMTASPAAVFTFSPDADFVSTLDNAETFRTIPVRHPPFIPFERIASENIRPPVLWYLAFPNMTDTPQAITVLSSIYRTHTTVTYTHDDYTMDAIRFSDPSL